MTDIGSRDYQMYPALDQRQIDIATRFASAGPRQFAPGELVFDVGDRSAPAWLVVQGSMDVFRHDGMTRTATVTTHAIGQFSGEVSQLSGRPALAGARAGSDGCTALAFDSAHLRALIIGSAELGELMMRAFILRRVALIDQGGAGSVLIGTPGSAALTRLEGFLRSNGHPYIALDAASDDEGRALIERLGIVATDLPLMVCSNGDVIKNPTDAEAAYCLGITPDLKADATYDVAIVGAGPAGLAAAVYAASEGLSVIILDERSAGGQAGASARIENYLGFPTGISGRALAGRAFNQALKFGAELVVPVSVEGIVPPSPDAGGPPLLTLKLSGDRTVRARTVIVASGARYRRPAIAGIHQFEGSGISYWASPIEAKLCEGEQIALVGGGNSAGQAVAFLAPQVSRLHLVVRRKLEETMSHYLIERIASLANVELHVGSEIVRLDGDRQDGLTGAVIHDRTNGSKTHLPLRHMFLFIGADPNTDWIRPHAKTDDKGFILTGRPFAETASAPERPAFPLETCLPNVFAIGDVRSDSTKRVAAAVGEGAAVVSQIHAALQFMNRMAEVPSPSTAPDLSREAVHAT
ncbi:FAD-dependent oxidoreductase [Rhizobium sp. SAFR-030]|uniref:FAD-dependent oxidoreductase n=1 Tax=Rhizobium sp. SAFR-030 TaxID=3387277 RepID=UPI003F7EB3C4